jgi:RNA polymerase sigma-70 factor (ECF subfamily)
VWSLARKLTNDPTEAEDAVQEAFIEIWKNASRYDASVASEATFVTMIARRRLIDRWRQRGRRPNGDASDVSELPIEDVVDHHVSVEVAEEVARVTRAMSRLHPNQQKALRLAVCDGWSHQQIGDHLSMPLGTVKTNIRRGLMRVRALLDSDGSATRKEAAL